MTRVTYAEKIKTIIENLGGKAFVSEIYRSMEEKDKKDKKEKEKDEKEKE